MFYSISGKLIAKKPDYVVVETSGIAFKISISARTARELPKLGRRLRLFCHLYSSQNDIFLYGFLREEEKEIFELLNSINGIGPKAALRILGVMKPESLLAVVGKGRTDLLIKAAGVGVKKAARIVLELKDKIKRQNLKVYDKDLETDLNLDQVLKSLGYKKTEIEGAVKNLSPKLRTLEEKLKAALKILGGN